MTTLIVTVDNKKYAQQLARFLRTIEYVKEVRVEDPEDALAEDDWILPGRPATEAEIDKLLDDMDKDDDNGYTTEELLAHLEEWKKKNS